MRKMKRGIKSIVLTERMKNKIRMLEKERKADGVLITQLQAASLLGVCVPTYRKWRRQIEKEDAEKAGC